MANRFPSDAKSVEDWFAERANRHESRLTQLEIARLGKVWIGPTILTGIYTWQNGFDDAGDPYFPFQYRLFDKDHLQVRGTIADTGTSGAVGFTLLPPFWPNKRISVWGDVDVAGTPQLAVLYIDPDTGQVTINF